MRKTVRLSGLFIVIMLGLSIFVNAQTKTTASKDTENFLYEIEGVAVGTQGTYMIKVWTYSKKPSVSINQTKRNAVHGIIFKGFMGKQGLPGQKPLATPAVEKEKKAFFDEFFVEGGNFNRYVTGAGDGDLAAGDIMKVGKQYKIGVVVSVAYSSLKKALEDAGVISK
jgi:hypothetical protein